MTAIVCKFSSMIKLGAFIVPIFCLAACGEHQDTVAMEDQIDELQLENLELQEKLASIEKQTEKERRIGAEVASPFGSYIGSPIYSEKKREDIRGESGEIYKNIGDMYIGPNGESYTRIGNDLMRSDGSYCSKTGNTYYCN